MAERRNMNKVIRDIIDRNCANEDKNKANNYRERLIDEISHDDMIKIMFTDFIKKQGATKTIEIGEEYLR